MKIAVLTGGGDVPSLNSALKGLTLGALQQGWEVVGFRQGWKGPLQIVPTDPSSAARWSLTMTATTVRTIDRFGGTFLHSSRTNPNAVKSVDLPLNVAGQLPKNIEGDTFDCTTHLLSNLQTLGIDAVVAIGGDDTLGYCERLHREGFPVIGIPKTMDNDVFGTDYCLGFATAVQRTVSCLHQLRTCTASHERFAVVEVMGRNAGYTALIPGYLAGADRVLIAEVPFEVERLGKLLLSDKQHNPSGYAMVVVSEGASMKGQAIVESGQQDAYGHRKLGGIGQLLSEALKKNTGVDIIYQNLGYLVRSGPPDPLDTMVAFNFANLAIESLHKRQFGQLVCLQRGVYTTVPMTTLSAGIKRVDVAAYYDSHNYCPNIRSVAGLSMYL